VPDGQIHGAPSGTVVSLEATIIKADGRRVELGTIASSDPERVPLTPRPEEADGTLRS